MKKYVILALVCILTEGIVFCVDENNSTEPPLGAQPFTENKIIEEGGEKTTLISNGYKIQRDGNDVVVGPWKLSLSDGTIIESGYYDNEGGKTGTWTRFYQDGKVLWTASYLNNLLDGPARGYDNDGKMIHASWRSKGKQEGISVDFSSEGKIITATKFKNGIKTETMVAEDTPTFAVPK